METPKISIDGKIYEPAPPTMKVWRETIDFLNADKTTWTLDDLGKRYAAYIVKAFNQRDVTMAAVEEHILAADLVPVGNQLMNWVYMQILEPLSKVPNGAAPSGD